MMRVSELMLRMQEADKHQKPSSISPCVSAGGPINWARLRRFMLQADIQSDNAD
jgi:hypothetical protein